jgi:hypothetical protein
VPLKAAKPDAEAVMRDARTAGEARTSNFVALALIVGLVAFVSCQLARDGGNLTWDDAGYLADAYDCVRYARNASDNAATRVARVGWTLLHQGFQPPFLVAWITPWLFLFGPDRLSCVIWCATALPFALLLLTAGRVAARTLYPRAAPWAVICIAASPLSLNFGGKVMVETFLGLWVLLALDAAAQLLNRPTSRRAALLGLWLGLAAVTKFTAFLLLGGPALYFVIAAVRTRRVPAAAFATATAVALLVAGPWYGRNYQNVLEHAWFSSQFDVLALGKKDESVRLARLVAAAGAIAGWGVLVTAASAEVARNLLGPGVHEPLPGGRHFERMALLGLVISAVTLLFPSYYETRFLLPAWPAFATVLGARCCAAAESLGTRWKAGLAGLLALSAAYSLVVVDRERLQTRSTTYWDAGSAVAELATQRGAHTIGNVGETPDWNIAKLRLASRLQARAAACVFRDLSRFEPEQLAGALEECDAFFVLDQDLLPPLVLSTPAMNRAYGALPEALADGQFERVVLAEGLDVPRLQVYVRKK